MKPTFFNEYSLDEWLSWLEKNHPKEIDLGLSRISRVAAHLNLLAFDALIVTVGGTNGKGSCVAASAAILKAADYDVGVYTSPHLLDYSERIQINGQYATDQSICEAFEAIYQAADAEQTSLTYFEYGTLAALYLFRKAKVSALVLEVGLGGRLDAVNILDADIVIITSIDLDHQDWLGDTREKIGYEKAGIMRASKPMICADANPPQSLIDHAKNLGVDSYYLNQDFFYEIDGDKWRWWNAYVDSGWQKSPKLPLPSMAAALQLATCLRLNFSKFDLFNLVADLSVFGRFQYLFKQERQWILDVAHNPAATALLSSRLKSWKAQHPDSKIHALVAMMSDKDRLNSLQNLQQEIDYWYLAELSFLPRAASTRQMTENLTSLGLSVTGQGKVGECLPTMIHKSKSNDLLLVFGSFFTVAEAMKFLDVSLIKRGE